MNTANLQIEGLLLAIAALTRAAIDKGLMDAAEVVAALDSVTAVAGSERERPELSSANREAIRFPIRFLRESIANPNAPFSQIARQIGRDLDSDEAPAPSDDV